MEPAEKLASALDAEDYIAARMLLDDSCEYEVRGALIKGGDAIIASYQGNGDNGRKRFDDIVYKSSVSLIGPNQARIDYTDIITHGGETHVHRCAQEVAWNEAGKITNVNHIDLPGEGEALEEFKRSHLGSTIGEQGVDPSA